MLDIDYGRVAQEIAREIRADLGVVDRDHISNTIRFRFKRTIYIPGNARPTELWAQQNIDRFAVESARSGEVVFGHVARAAEKMLDAEEKRVRNSHSPVTTEEDEMAPRLRDLDMRKELAKIADRRMERDFFGAPFSDDDLRRSITSSGITSVADAARKTSVSMDDLTKTMRELTGEYTRPTPFGWDKGEAVMPTSVKGELMKVAAEAKRLKELEDAKVAVAKEKKDVETLTASEQFDEIKGVIGKVNEELIAAFGETYTAQIWAEVLTEQGEKYQIISEEDFRFGKLVFIDKLGKIGLHVIMSHKDDGDSLLVPPDVLEDAFPDLSDRINSICLAESDGALRLGSLDRAAKRLVKDKAAFKKALVEATYGTVSTANEKAATKKKNAREDFYAKAKDYGAF